MINLIIKTITMIWLGLCAFVAYFGCALFGFICCFSEIPFMYNVTPFIGITCVICIIFLMIRIKRSNPVAYLESLRGKKTI